MTEARIARVVPSIDEARVFLSQARRFASDAEVDGLTGTSPQLLLYQSAICSCDAALVAAGMKVDGSEGGHVLRLTETARLLALDPDLLDALDEARQVRGGSAYQAGFVLEDQVDDASDAARRLIEEVERFVEDAAGR